MQSGRKPKPTHDAAPGGRGKAELLAETVHDLKVGLCDGHLRDLLPVAGGRLYDGAVLGDEFLRLFPMKLYRVDYYEWNYTFSDLLPRQMLSVGKDAEEAIANVKPSPLS